MSEKRLKLSCRIDDRAWAHRLCATLAGYRSFGTSDFGPQRSLFADAGVDADWLFQPENVFEVLECRYEEGGILHLKAAAGAFSGSDIFEALMQALGEAGAHDFDVLLYCSMTGTVTCMEWSETHGVSFHDTDISYSDEV
jgi:hypothetical protein